MLVSHRLDLEVCLRKVEKVRFLKMYRIMFRTVFFVLVVSLFYSCIFSDYDDDNYPPYHCPIDGFFDRSAGYGVLSYPLNVTLIDDDIMERYNNESSNTQYNSTCQGFDICLDIMFDGGNSNIMVKNVSISAYNDFMLNTYNSPDILGRMSISNVTLMALKDQDSGWCSNRGVEELTKEVNELNSKYTRG